MASQVEEPGDARGSSPGSEERVKGSARDREKSAPPEGEADADMTQADQEEYARHLEMLANVSFTEGKLLRATTLNLTPSDVIVNIGYKADGVCDIREFTDPDGNVTANVGDVYDFLIERSENAEGYVTVSREKAEKLKVWDR